MNPQASNAARIAKVSPDKAATVYGLEDLERALDERAADLCKPGEDWHTAYARLTDDPEGAALLEAHQRAK